MHLIWKLLRSHVSLPQLAGFFFANLLGMWIVMLGFQFYRDVAPVFTSDDSFFNNNFLVVSKRITTAGTLSGGSNDFSAADITELQRQPFCLRAAPFTTSQYRVSAAMSAGGASPMRTELFFEAVPDSFVDTQQADWSYTPGSTEVPVIMPRAYLAIYNFGFAGSRGLPKLSDGVAGMVDMDIYINGAAGRHGSFRGRIAGFSSRVNTILVPQAFMDWSNAQYEPGRTEPPQRLIVEVRNPADDAITTYMKAKGLDVEADQLDAGKATYFLKVVVSVVMLVGLLVSLLSFYILMLSIYLLVQKNTTKLENLLLLGYSPRRVSRPYQLLAVGLNAAVLLLALLLLLLCRGYYLDMTRLVYPQLKAAGLLPTLLLGLCIFLLVSTQGALAVRRKVMNIWKRR